MTIAPFKISIPDAELDLLQKKLELTRLPSHNYDWTEENGITSDKLHDILKFWLSEYDWRKEEARLNELPQFMTQIEVDNGFGTLDVHFLHSPVTEDKLQHDAIPLLFLHGWPGNFTEVVKGLPLLNQAGFHVVAPSLPGYGFSSYTRKRGFDHRQHAEVMNKLMLQLGYEHYVVQGGDWGSDITHAMGICYPENVRAVHQNMLQSLNFDYPPKDASIYSAHELKMLDRAYKWFLGSNNAYSLIQAQRPICLGHAMHDSPMGLLSWFLDKLIDWSDQYPWTPTEIITWTLLHYFPGPTNGFIMYTEDGPAWIMTEGTWAQEYVKVPCGYSSFPREIIMVPKSWAERTSNCVFYREHNRGGHFAMYEVPDILVADLKEFYRSVWTPKEQ